MRTRALRTSRNALPTDGGPVGRGPLRHRHRWGNAMSKRLVMCCDGTWNTADQACPTNVTKLALGLAERSADGQEQRVFYHRGVGTGAWDRLRGGAFGVGLSRNVQDTYRFL